MSPWHLHECDARLHYNITLIAIHNLQFIIPVLKFAIHSSIFEKALVEYIDVCTDTNNNEPLSFLIDVQLLNHQNVIHKEVLEKVMEVAEGPDERIKEQSHLVLLEHIIWYVIWKNLYPVPVNQ